MTGDNKEKNNNKINKEAFTLIEVLVSTVLFALIIISVTGVFKLSIEAQRNAISTQNVQESLKYFLEITAKEIRMAQKDNGQCGAPDSNGIFFVETGENGDILSFRNSYGECVRYFLEADGDNLRFAVSRHLPAEAEASDFISPERIKIEGLHFILKGDGLSSQPMVTINLRAKSLDNSNAATEMTLQTSVTSRYYK